MAQVSSTGTAPTLSSVADSSSAATLKTATPIKHLVVIFQENVSFDHYFGTYPKAANPAGEPAFQAAPSTPSVNGLDSTLLTHNPNSSNPVRLGRAQARTCDMDHNYTDEQKATDNGLMDKFNETLTGKAGDSNQYCPSGIVMDYYDGNTVTGYWNYAQHFAMNDNSYNTVFGPSTPGALNLVAGDTAPVSCGPSSSVVGSTPCSLTPPASGTSTSGAVYGDSDPYYDTCSKGGTTDKSSTIAMSGKNIGDLLNASGVTWGWFQGGFDNCAAKHVDVAYDQVAGINPATDPNTTGDYNPHHEPFQYYASTSNPAHLPPTSTAMIGHTDQANHQYDLTDFWAAADAGNLPAVSYLKAPNYQDGHAGYSDPLDEQNFVVSSINHLESLPSWASTAVVISYDDSDGWYDHVMGPIVNHSHSSVDANCGTNSDGIPGRCGYGPRLPFIVISPYSRTNFVDNTVTDQTSSLRFVEDNWLGGQRISTQSFDNKAGTMTNMFNFSPLASDMHRVFLDPTTGQVIPNSGAVEISFTSTNPGLGSVYFGPGPRCSGLVEVATRDMGAGTTAHRVLVSGNDLPGTVGNIGLTPGTTYSYEVVTTSPSGTETDNNGGSCYTFSVPS
ncbi:MAG TPA: alkaline phosphatase family protein [Chloroflexota bacterium]